MNRVCCSRARCSSARVFQTMRAAQLAADSTALRSSSPSSWVHSAMEM